MDPAATFETLHAFAKTHSPISKMIHFLSLLRFLSCFSLIFNSLSQRYELLLSVCLQMWRYVRQKLFPPPSRSSTPHGLVCRHLGRVVMILIYNCLHVFQLGEPRAVLFGRQQDAKNSSCFSIHPLQHVFLGVSDRGVNHFYPLSSRACFYFLLVKWLQRSERILFGLPIVPMNSPNFFIDLSLVAFLSEYSFVNLERISIITNQYSYPNLLLVIGPKKSIDKSSIGCCDSPTKEKQLIRIGAN